MWYSGGDGRADHGIGYAFSTDSINWTRDLDNPIFHKTDGVAWRDNRTYTPMVIDDEMWFTGVSSAGVYSIGHAKGSPSAPVVPYSRILTESLGILRKGISGETPNRSQNSRSSRPYRAADPLP